MYMHNMYKKLTLSSIFYWESPGVKGTKPKYEENSCRLKRKFAPFEPEGFSPRAQMEQIFSEACRNFLNIAVSPEDTR